MQHVGTEMENVQEGLNQGQQPRMMRLLRKMLFMALANYGKAEFIQDRMTNIGTTALGYTKGEKV